MPGSLLQGSSKRASTHGPKEAQGVPEGSQHFFFGGGGGVRAKSFSTELAGILRRAVFGLEGLGFRDILMVGCAEKQGAAAILSSVKEVCWGLDFNALGPCRIE